MPTNRSREWLIQWIRDNTLNVTEDDFIRFSTGRIREIVENGIKDQRESYKLARKLGMPRKSPKPFLREETAPWWMVCLGVMIGLMGAAGFIGAVWPAFVRLTH